jgi:hypothetical protein
VKVYGHNGYFRSLKDVVHFYNVRDTGREKFPPAEVPATVNHAELGNLELTDAEENELVAFLKTLTDGYKASAVEPAVLTDAPRNFEGARDIIRVLRFVEQKRTAAREEAASERRR